MSGPVVSAARVDDPDSIFKGCSPAFAAQGSPNFNIDNKAAHRKSDVWTNHICPPPPATPNTIFTAYLLSGSTYVLINNLDIGRVGDPIFRSGKISGPLPYTIALAFVALGSGTFFVGGSGNGVTTPQYARAGTARAGSRTFDPNG